MWFAGGRCSLLKDMKELEFHQFSLFSHVDHGKGHKTKSERDSSWAQVVLVKNNYTYIYKNLITRQSQTSQRDFDEVHRLRRELKCGRADVSLWVISSAWYSSVFSFKGSSFIFASPNTDPYLCQIISLHFNSLQPQQSPSSPPAHAGLLLHHSWII